MTEFDPESLFKGALEDIAARYKSTDRLAVVVLHVDDAEIRRAGSRSQQLLLHGVPTFVAAGPAPPRVESLFYYSGTAAPESGDIVIVIIAGSMEDGEQMWVIESLEAVESEVAVECAEGVAARVRALITVDPFSPLAEP